MVRDFTVAAFSQETVRISQSADNNPRVIRKRISFDSFLTCFDNVGVNQSREIRSTVVTLREIYDLSTPNVNLLKGILNFDSVSANLTIAAHYIYIAVRLNHTVAASWNNFTELSFEFLFLQRKFAHYATFNWIIHWLIILNRFIFNNTSREEYVPEFR